MIISSKHKFFFLHCRKTAGSSVVVSLARYLGPDDLQLSALIETWQNDIPFTDRVRREARANLRPRLTRQKIEQTMALWGWRGDKRQAEVTKALLLDSYRDRLGPIPQHTPAATLARVFPEEWAAFSKLCIVRNPWDKTVSDYFWRCRQVEEAPSFDTYARALCAGDDLSGLVPVGYDDNWSAYTINDQVIADEVVRYETLVPDLTASLKRLGVDFDGWLPNAKGAHRKQAAGAPAKAKRDFRSHYTPELKNLVGDHYANEINAFGYSF